MNSFDLNQFWNKLDHLIGCRIRFKGRGCTRQLFIITRMSEALVKVQSGLRIRSFYEERGEILCSFFRSMNSTFHRVPLKEVFFKLESCQRILLISHSSSLITGVASWEIKQHRLNFSVRPCVRNNISFSDQLHRHYSALTSRSFRLR